MSEDPLDRLETEEMQKRAESFAIYWRRLFDACLTKGFTREEAIHLVSAEVSTYHRSTVTAVYPDGMIQAMIEIANAMNPPEEED